MGVATSRSDVTGYPDYVGQKMALWTASLYSDEVVSWLLNVTMSRI